MALNNVSIMGRITKDIDLRYTQSQVAVVSFSIANERDNKSKDGERITDFYDIVAWRNTAEFISKYFTKGRMIIVNGHLQTRDWEDKEGKKRRSTEIIADSVYFGDSKKEDGNVGSYSQQSTGTDFVEVEDDDPLPF